MKLSIITVNFNNRDGLQRTIDSVVSQTWRDFEWIIIDGGSTDGSKELIEQYQDHFAYWCSEPDKGIYNAMNKGIDKAKGEYLIFMNSGDCFMDCYIVEEFVNATWMEDVIVGDVAYNGNNMSIKRHPDINSLDIEYFIYSTICHQASFIKRRLFELYGVYDECLSMSSDWKFFIEVLIIHNHSYRHWQRIIVDYNTDGMSSLSANLSKINNERTQILNQYSRIVNPIIKRDQLIQELDLSLFKIIKHRILTKMNAFFVKLTNRQ